MEELINFIIVIVFIGIALAIKLMEMASRKKMPLPLPEPIFEEIPSEELEEVEIKPEQQSQIIQIVPQKVEVKLKKPFVEIPAIEISKFSRNDLQNGIILSAVLGPPRSLSRWVPSRH